MEPAGNQGTPERHILEQNKYALQLLDDRTKGKNVQLREFSRKKWKLSKPLAKQTLSDWVKEKAE